MARNESASALAIVSLILGILSLMFALIGCLSCMFTFFSLPMAGTAAFLGYKEVQAIGMGDSPEAGLAMAKVGGILGASALVLDLLIWVGYFVIIGLYIVVAMLIGILAAFA
jgi:hypothetical protein